MIVQPKDEDFPFCSDRCRKIDLGKWAMGVYKISSPVLDPEVLEDLGGLGGGHDKGRRMSDAAAIRRRRRVRVARGRKTLWAWTVATFFGAGLGKPGPGTWGSVAAVLLWAAFAWALPPAAQRLCCSR